MEEAMKIQTMATVEVGGKKVAVSLVLSIGDGESPAADIVTMTARSEDGTAYGVPLNIDLLMLIQAVHAAEAIYTKPTLGATCVLQRKQGR